MDMLFETEHLIVRKFKDEDAQQLYENHRDEEVRKRTAGTFKILFEYPFTQMRDKQDNGI